MNQLTLPEVWNQCDLST